MNSIKTLGKRFFFFAAVNIAVVSLILLITWAFGLDTRFLKETGLDLKSLAIYALLWGFAGSLISLFISRWMAKTMMGVRTIEHPQGNEEIFLVQTIQQLSGQLGLKMPEVGIYDSEEINAFATGWGQNHSLVAVSSGLLRTMNKNEVEGVLAHEMAHVSNGDMVTMTLIQGIINAFVIFAAHVAAFAVSKFMSRDNEEGAAIGGMVHYFIVIGFQIFFGIFASLIVMAFSRWREYGADAGGARLVGKEKMARALGALKKHIELIDVSAPREFMAMKISNKSERLEWFSSHPDLEKRIARLKNYS